jgi:septal ring factor EnvC (AmiA/AmiB activator)|tara:strand:+ start:137 stop:460 length:324 start_codon:yes stop_codon:yes gene_type:complete
VEEKVAGLSKKLDRHIGQTEKEIKDIKKSLKSTDDKFNVLSEQLAHNTYALNQLTEMTEGVVGFYKDAEATIRMGGNLQRFLTWVIKIPIIGLGLYTVVKWLIENAP